MSDNNAKEQAIAQAASIVALVSSLNVDYERLEELRDELKELQDIQKEAYELRQVALRAGDVTGAANATKAEEDADKIMGLWKTTNGEELTELEAAAGECKDADEARERIQNDALDVKVRSDWWTPNSACDGTSNNAAEFMILLCTGGPAVRIMGELDGYQEPCRAWIQAQDWGTQWERLDMYDTELTQEQLLQYCQQFYFGE